MRIDLAGEWQLTGWRQNDWRLGLTPERAKVQEPDIPSVPIAVPGSVRGALERAGIVPDSTVGAQSRLSEWIEHRHWVYSREIPSAASEWLDEHPRERIVLECEGLDTKGVVLVDERIVGEFEGSFSTHRFDITESIADGGRTLQIVFTDLPQGLGQNGWTSRIREFKDRFSFGWDWTPRLVQVGISGPIRLVASVGMALHLARVSTDYRADDGTGSVTIDASACAIPPAAVVSVRITGPDVDITSGIPDHGNIVIPVRPRPWHVRPMGRQALYTLTLAVRAADGVSEQREFVLGFRELMWVPTEAAPKGADNWLCVVNGHAVFLSGVNWVPIRPDRADIPSVEYRSRLVAYRDMGMTMIRVWGGAGAEADVFYDLCDELGLLVWQELPLSSSGLDNEPPIDDTFARDLARIATLYAERLRHRPCLAVWCGGNELTRVSAPAVPGQPLDDSHPALGAARAALERSDPGRRYIATSPMGPRFDADPAEYGAGVHHDVHGPWEWTDSEESWEAYWGADDAVLRSEVGVAGATGIGLLTQKGLLPDVPRAELRSLWTHSSGWWLRTFDDADPDQPIEAWVISSQQRQQRMLRIAASSTLSRFPRAAGFLVWLGHDTFPCAVSLSLLDWNAQPKPAADGLKSVFGVDIRCTSDR